MTKREVYKLARERDYQIKYGNRHYMHNGAVVKDENGMNIKGYEIIDLKTQTAEWGTYNAIYDHLYQWEDVVQFVTEHCQ